MMINGKIKLSGDKSNSFIRDSINIFDILSLSDIILLGVEEGCGYEISDIRDDGEINILDIITLVQYVLYAELPGDNSTLETTLLFK